MRLLPLFIASLLVATLAFLADPVHAQTATLTVSPPTWQMRSRTNGEINQINRQDCLDDATIRFPVVLTGIDSGATFEVWSGSGCADKDSRQMNSTCVQVALEELNATSVTISVQDMLQPFNDAALGIDTGSAATCDGAAATSTPVERHLYFILVNASTLEPVITPYDWKFDYDTVAPAPPTGLSGGPGEASVVINFDETESTDLKGYRIYCSDVAAEVPPEDGAGGGPDSASSADGACSSSVLIPGKAPTIKECGSVSSESATSVIGDDLTNGVLYAAAVASEDDLGNVGVLSEIVCATPKEATGFYEAYRAAGGRGGGGFCSFGPPRRGLFAGCFTLLVAGLAFARRRK